jgi:hypothetical protein
MLQTLLLNNNKKMKECKIKPNTRLKVWLSIAQKLTMAIQKKFRNTNEDIDLSFK